jgi:hypothetical protein
MGLLTAGPIDQDLKHCLLIADAIAREWNEHGRPINGITLFVNPAAMLKCCAAAYEIFDQNHYFPKPPGPFKRAAAFVVLGRLQWFFEMRGDNAPDPRKQEREHRAWLARFMVLAIPGVLRRTKLGDGHILDAWKKFPSPHYQLEFLAWMRWLDGFGRYRGKFEDFEWNSFYRERLARKVMSTSLMIESCYYLNVAKGFSSLQSKVEPCLTKLEDEQEMDLCFWPVKQ